MQSLYVLLFSSLACAVYAGHYAVGVRGTLLCGTEPLEGATVKLWELDTWPNADDLLSTVKTDKQGRFEISGTESELFGFNFNAVVKFYHRCNNKGLFNIPNICKRKVTYEIPNDYITGGKTVGKWFEMGVMNVEAKGKGEDTECIQF